MHICGMDFSSLASYWQIKALLMLEPSVVTPQNQYFPANAERMAVHCLEWGCIGKYIPQGPRDFSRAGIFDPEAREIPPGSQYITPLGSVRGHYNTGDCWHWSRTRLIGLAHSPRKEAKPRPGQRSNDPRTMGRDR